ncbi:MAG: hypothetical protein QGG40_19740, partial [Myxococcota bacterium]|nr:hypothetical protein [Myxococcota bacterium]
MRDDNDLLQAGEFNPDPEADTVPMAPPVGIAAPGRPRIELRSELHEVVDEVVEALANCKNLYQRNTELVR